MSEAVWHYIENGHSAGPVTQQEIIAMIESGKLPLSALVWTAGTENWQPAQEVFGLSGEIIPPAIPPEAMGLAGWSDQPPHPWRRYFARILDIHVNGVIFFVVFGIICGIAHIHILDHLPEMTQKKGGWILDSLLTSFGSMFVTAAMIGSSGRSIGKWIFGLKVVSHNGKLGYRAALKREALVWMRGIAFGIPFINFVTLIFANNRLMKKNITSWDEQMNLRVIARPNDNTQIILSITGAVLLAMVIIAIRRM